MLPDILIPARTFCFSFLLRAELSLSTITIIYAGYDCFNFGTEVTGIISGFVSFYDAYFLVSHVNFKQTSKYQTQKCVHGSPGNWSRIPCETRNTFS
jgi:hypothetical protein